MAYKYTVKDFMADEGIDEFNEDVDLSYAGITTLEGCPCKDEVDGDLILLGNDKLTSLKGCPKIIDGKFSIESCSGLKSLRYGPKKVGKFRAVSTEFKNLKYAPESPTYELSFNQRLDNLEGLPETAKFVFADYTGITSTKGCPNNLIKLNLSFSKNLKDLILPSEVREIIMTGTDVKSYLDLPKTIYSLTIPMPNQMQLTSLLDWAITVKPKDFHLIIDNNRNPSSMPAFNTEYSQFLTDVIEKIGKIDNVDEIEEYLVDNFDNYIPRPVRDLLMI